jgi:drug/metabolite transporter (DMT)-like permease
MKTAIMLVIITLSGALGDVYIAKGMKQVGEIHTLRLGALISLGRRVLSNTAFLLGLLYMIIGFVAFVAVLAWADLSFIIPATSLSFVLTTLGAKWILKENINRLRWFGTVLVGLGIALISLP